MRGPGKSPEDIVGRCSGCDRPMGIESRLRDLGIVRHAGHGRCDMCAKRARMARQAPKRSGVGVLPPRPAWMLSAPCASTDPDLFYDHATVTHAKKICATCPLRAACASYAIRAGETWGVWGGLSATQRAELTEDDLYGDVLDGLAA